MDEELVDDPPLPPGLTLFLVKGMAKDQDDAPGPSTPVLVEYP